MPAVRRGAARGGAERLVFLVAAAVIALHVLVDAFVTPGSGVGRGERLFPALLQIALVAAAVAVSWRSRSGVRAVIALLLGVVALEMAGVTFWVMWAEGMRAGFLTAFLLAPAGALLCVLGARLLWVSRTGGRYRHVRRALLAVAVFTAYSVLLPVAIAYAATHLARVETPPLDIGRPYDDVTIRAFDGMRLAGRHVPSRNGATVIVFPRAWATEQIRMLARNGYGVLALDMRGYGESEGAPNAFGWGYARDIDAAVAFLEEDADEGGAIGGLGISVGGEQMLEAAAGNPAVAAVMTEGAGLRSVRETFARRGPAPAEKLLQAPHDALLTAAVALFAWRSPPPLQDLTAQISRRAVHFVHGEHDNANEAALTPAYHTAAGEPKEHWEVPGAGHTQGVVTQPQDYEERMTAFFERHLLGR